MRIPLLLLSSVIFWLCANPGFAPAQPSGCDTGGSETSARIFNSSPASLAEWPGITALILKDRFNGNEYFFCGGNVIGKEWVVTAAHCVDSLKRDASGKYQRPDGTYLRLIAGLVDLSQATDASIFDPAAIYLHPSYTNPYHGYDIALIKLTRPYTGRYASPRQFSEIGYLRVGGFGESKSTGKPSEASPTFLRAGSVSFFAASRTLQNVPLPYISYRRCSQSWSKQQCGNETCIVRPDQICAGNVFRGEDACVGDSGGPLVAVDPATACPMLVGLVSWGSDPCGVVGRFGVYTRLSAYQRWITNTTRGEVAFKEAIPVRLTDEQNTLLAELDKVLTPAKGRINLFPKFKGEPKPKTPYLLKIASEIKGRLLLITVSQSGNVLQLFPNSPGEVALSRIAEGVTTFPREGSDFDFLMTDETPGKEQLIAIIVPDSFPMDTLLKNSKYMAVNDVFTDNIPMTEGEKSGYLVVLLDSITRAISSAGKNGAGALDGWAYQNFSYELKGAED